MVIDAFNTGDGFARCTYCASDFNISHCGRSDVTGHVRGKHHGEMAKAYSSRSVTSFFRPQTTKNVIDLWSTFVAKHNLAFQTSKHATKLFHRMFPGSEIAKTFACGHSKTVAISKEALAPHYLSKTLHDMSKIVR